MNRKMEKQEYKDGYIKSVEGSFGILKEQFPIEKKWSSEWCERKKDYT